MSDRHICTAVNPCTPDKGKRAQHPDAVNISSYSTHDGREVDVYKCPHCGKVFEVEITQ